MSQPTSEGAAFSQKGVNKDQGRDKNTCDKKYWKAKKCFECDKEGHPEYHYPEGNNKYTKKNKSDDDKSRASRSIKSSKSDIAKLKSQIKKTFTTLESKIDELGDEDTISPVPIVKTSAEIVISNFITSQYH